MVVVGSDFPESKIVAEIYAQAPRPMVQRRPPFGIGSRGDYIPRDPGPSIDSSRNATGNPLQYFGSEEHRVRPAGDVELALYRSFAWRPVDPSIPHRPMTAIPSPSPGRPAMEPQEHPSRSVPHAAEAVVGAPRFPSTANRGHRDWKAKYGLDIKLDNFVAISDGGGPATVMGRCPAETAAGKTFSALPRRFQNKFVGPEDPKNKSPGTTAAEFG